jgi:hypothetical protein
VSRKLAFRLLVVISLVWVAWAAVSMVGAGGAVTVSVIDDVGLPVAGAEVRRGNTVLGVTTDDGRVVVDWARGTASLEVVAPGYPALQLPVLEKPAAPIEAVLRARLFRGRVLNREGSPVEGAYVTNGAATAVTDAEGRFTVRKAEPGRVTVWRPAWDGAEINWDGSPGESMIAIEPQVMKAVHIGGEAARDNWQFHLDLVRTTELNAVMLDLKDESGLVFYQSAVPMATQVGAAYPYYDLPVLTAQAREAGAYVIGRIVVFQDPIAAIRAPEMAVWDTDLNGPYAAGKQYFLDPTDPAAQAYGLDLAVEACRAGIDEIQFDYVRFPDNRRESARFDGGVTPEVRIATIRDFLATAVAELHPLGCAVAADIFGFITRAVDDGGIGQRWEDLTAVIDVASPMLYPSHYASGWYGFQRPNDHPAEMVAHGLDDGLQRLSRQMVVRPWLQDFGYSADQVRSQIDEAEARGLGWMLWNAKSVVTVEALRPAGD